MSKQQMSGKAKPGPSKKDKIRPKMESKAVSSVSAQSIPSVKKLSNQVSANAAKHSQEVAALKNQLNQITSNLKSKSPKGRPRREGISAPHMHTSRQKGFSSVHVESGEVFVASLQGKVGLQTGDIMFSRRNRAQLAGSQLQVWGSIYTRWRVIKQEYVYIPAVGTTFNGQILMAQDPDPTGKYDTPTTSIQQLTTLPGNTRKQAYESAVCHMPHSKYHDNLFTQDIDANLDDYTERFSSAGNFFVVCMAPGGMNVDSTIATLWLRFTYEFSEPRLQLNALIDPTQTSFTPREGMFDPDGEKFSILDQLMRLVGSLKLSVTLLNSTYDALSAFFDWIPYTNGLFSSYSALHRGTNAIVDRRERKGLGVLAGDIAGFAPGNYQAVMCICMPAVAINPLINAYYSETQGQATNVFEGPETWFTFNNINGTGASQMKLTISYVGQRVYALADVPSAGVFSAGFTEQQTNDPPFPLPGNVPCKSIWIYTVSFAVTNIRSYFDTQITYRVPSDVDPGVWKTAMDTALSLCQVQYIFTNKRNPYYIQFHDNEPTSQQISYNDDTNPPGTKSIPSSFKVENRERKVIRSIRTDPVPSSVPVESKDLPRIPRSDPPTPPPVSIPPPEIDTRRPSLDGFEEVTTTHPVPIREQDKFILDALDKRIHDQIKHLPNSILNGYKDGSPEYLAIQQRIVDLKKLVS